MGDVSGDNTADIVDALLVAQNYLSLNSIPFDEKQADVNCDCFMDIVGALKIAQYYEVMIEAL